MFMKFNNKNNLVDLPNKNKFGLPKNNTIKIHMQIISKILTYHNFNSNKIRG